MTWSNGRVRGGVSNSELRHPLLLVGQANKGLEFAIEFGNMFICGDFDYSHFARVEISKS